MTALPLRLPIQMLAAAALALPAATILPAAPAAAQGYYGQTAALVRCESWDWRSAVCPLPGPVHDVRIARIHGGDCRQGATWRWDGRALQVRGGCRADFQVLLSGNNWGGGYPGGQIVNCSSWNWQPARCLIGPARAVRIINYVAGDCREGRTWGYDRAAIWVTRGCRADFQIF